MCECMQVKTAKLLALLNVGFLGLVIAVTLLAIPGSVRLTVVGILCAGFTIGMYASPLSVMRMVIKTKSVEYMPFFLSFFLFLNGGIWSVYAVLVRDFYIGVKTAKLVALIECGISWGIVIKSKSVEYVPFFLFFNAGIWSIYMVLVKDFYIRVPNATGFVLGSIQLIIYAIYIKKSISTKSLEMMEEEGFAHFVKGAFEDNEEANMKCRNLHKRSSLPKPSINQQYSFQRILKTLT
ncbi:bidirectional sugar transporter SWEET17 [Quercus suber]|uniref:bidirectional sugar transporter SWEET17 n=1 Tax=Quercus suber TaxID=58331 RepID=UPI0032DE354D